MQVIRYVKDLDKIKFSNCGLDVKKNLLRILKCPCIPDNSLVFNGVDDIINFCGGVLLDVGCKQCGIFVTRKNGDIFIALKIGDGEEALDMYTYKPQVGKCDYGVIGLIALGCELHLYGLITEIEPGRFVIVEG